MTVTTTPSAAEMLTQQLDSTKPQAETKWYDAAIELGNRHRELMAEREERRTAEQEAEEQASMSTPDLIRSALVKKKPISTMPLNGGRVLTAALAGGSGSINGHARDSVADVIRQGLIHDGRTE